MGETGFGGSKGFFFFAEGEPDLRGAVSGIIVEAGAGNAGDADGFDKILGKRNVAGSGRIVGLVEVKARNIGHDVIRAPGLINDEARGFENAREPGALFRIAGGETVVIGARKL